MVSSGLGTAGIVAIPIPAGGAVGEVLTKQSGDNYDFDWDPAGGAGAPANAEYVVLALDATLTDERVLTPGTGLALVDGGAGGLVTLNVDATLQEIYDNATADPQIIAASGDPVTFRAFADPDTIFALQRNDAGQVMLVESLATGYEFTLGPVGNRSWVWSEPSTDSNPTTAQIIPDGRTKTVLPLATNTGLIQWDSLFTSNVPGGGGIGNDQGFGAIGLTGTLELLDQGNLFATSIVFNQATIIDVTAALSGPVYTMVNQPRLINTGATDRTVSQANAVRSQLRIQPQGAGDVTLTSHEMYFAAIVLDSSVSTGDAFCTLVSYFAAKAPSFLGVGGAITDFNVLDIPNIPAAGITNIRGINSAMANGLFINHTGVAASLFTGPVDFDGVITFDAMTTFDAIMVVTDTTIFQIGDIASSGAQFSRQVSGFSMEGFGGANDEGLDFAFQGDGFTTITPTVGGFGIKMASVEFVFGTGLDPDGTNNFVMAFAPGLRSTSNDADYAEVLFTSSSSIAVANAIPNFSTWEINAPPITILGGSIVDAANVLIQGNMSAGTNRYGLLVTSNPSGGTINHAARFTGSSGVRIDGILTHFGTLFGLYGVAPVVQSAAYTPTNVTPDRAYDANATSVNELADVVGTLIADLQLTGIIG